MNAEMKMMLEELAAQTCWCDDEDFVVDDYAGGNVDDAYSGGNRDGEVELARSLLQKFSST